MVKKCFLKTKKLTNHDLLMKYTSKYRIKTKSYKYKKLSSFAFWSLCIVKQICESQLSKNCKQNWTVEFYSTCGSDWRRTASIRSVTHFPADVIVAWSIVCSIAKARVNLGAGTRLSEVVCNGLTLPKPQFKYHITHR